MHLTLHLTSECNLACSYCYAPPERGRDMTREVAEAALRFGAERTEGSCGISFFGGEPLLRAELVRWTVGRARELEQEGLGTFHFKLTTNGLLLDDEFLDFSLREDVLIAMSLDGLAAAHDRHRRSRAGAPSFERAVAGLRRLLAARPYATVLLTVNPDTAALLADSVTWLVEEERVRYLSVSLNHAAPWDEDGLETLQAQYERLGELYLRWTREGRKFYLSPLEIKLSSHIKGAAYLEDRCELGRRQLSVAPDGHLYPCVQFVSAGPESEWCLGSVQRGLDEARREALRPRDDFEQEPCRDCAIRDRCQHTCGCLNRQATGSVRGVSPILCHSEQKLLEVADRVGAQLWREQHEVFVGKHFDEGWALRSLVEDVVGPMAGEAAR